MPYGYPPLSFMPTPQLGAGGPQEPDDDMARVAELLSMLEMEPSPQAPTPPSRVGAGRDIVGSIGDALLSMASVRAGGAPVGVGPFAAGQRETQRDYQDRLMEFQKRQTENEAANRTLRNQARIGMLGGKRSGMKAQLKWVDGVDEKGNKIRRPYLYDPSDETLRPISTTSGESQFEQFVPDAIVPGTVGGEEGVYRVPRVGGKATPVTAVGGSAAPATAAGERLRPPAKPGVVEDISNLAGILRNIDTIKANPLIAPGKRGEFTQRLKQEGVRALPLIGPQLSARMGPEVEGFEADLDNLRAKIQLLLTGKAVNPQEIKRLLALVPAGSTATNPDFFNQRIQRFEDEFKASMARQARLRPDLFTPDELLSLGETRSQTAAAPEGETPEQKKARIKAKYGIESTP